MLDRSVTFWLHCICTGLCVFTIPCIYTGCVHCIYTGCICRGLEVASKKLIVCQGSHLGGKKGLNSKSSTSLSPSRLSVCLSVCHLSVCFFFGPYVCLYASLPGVPPRGGRRVSTQHHQHLHHPECLYVCLLSVSLLVCMFVCIFVYIFVSMPVCQGSHLGGNKGLNSTSSRSPP